MFKTLYEVHDVTVLLFGGASELGMPERIEAKMKAIIALRLEGKGLAITSSRSHVSLQEFVDQMNIAEKFAILIGGNDVTNTALMRQIENI